MSSFKDKPLKKCHSDKRLTIDVIHNNMLNEFKSESKEVKKLKKEIKNEKNTKNLLYLKNKLKKEEEDNKKREQKYFFDNTILLNNYYNNDCNIIKRVDDNEKTNILNYFKKENKEEKEESKDVNDNIIDLYLSNIDDHYINSNYMYYSSDSENGWFPYAGNPNGLVQGEYCESTVAYPDENNLVLLFQMTTSGSICGLINLEGEDANGNLWSQSGIDFLIANGNLTDCDGACITDLDNDLVCDEIDDCVGEFDECCLDSCILKLSEEGEYMCGDVGE